MDEALDILCFQHSKNLFPIELLTYWFPEQAYQAMLQTAFVQSIINFYAIYPIL